MEKEMNEFVEALRGLKSAVIDLKGSMLDTRNKVERTVNDSHLSSTLTLLTEDIAFRRVLELTH